MTKRKQSAKDRKLAAEEHAMLAKWQSVPKFARAKHTEAPKVLQYELTTPPGRPLATQPSLSTPGGVAASTVNNQYTGDKVLGVCVMHKSSLVPVFSSQDATDIARMRR